ncbi:uncharacterized protein LOC129586970 [Paramacrobiotus metropolitanus]|uniref:uncharacterized protein LOC129586970 n=1 Tax=Paramacrobiotus metropolitanus TaxID=2943436 RepID=UPI002445A250|nr:uncharacterized protein LOC129586970 [Paramacrobiotus metropolitanus]
MSASEAAFTDESQAAQRGLTEPLPYLAWALPSRLVPILRANKQRSLIPRLNFFDPDKSATVATSNFTPDVSSTAARNATTSDSQPECKTVNQSTSNGALHMTFEELWRRYNAAIQKLQEQTVEFNGSEKLFEWLDEATHRNTIAQRVYKLLCFDIESRLSQHLEWAHRKLYNPGYRIGFAQLNTSPRYGLNKTDLSAAISHEPPQPAIQSAVLLERTNRGFIYDKISEISAANQNFPALLSTLHTEKSKSVLWELARLLGQKRTSSKASLSMPVIPIKSKRKSTKTKRKRISQGKSTRSTVLTKRIMSFPVRKGRRRTRTSAQHRKSSQLENENYYDDDNDNIDDTMEAPKGANQRKRRKVTTHGQDGRRRLSRQITRTPQEFLTQSSIVSGMSSDSEISESRLALEAKKRPVPVKKGHHEYYTPDELTLLRKHAFNRYTIDLYDDAMDIAADDQVIEEGPRLPVPHLMKMLADLAARKRWRLSDLFRYADKDKSWKLDMAKVQRLCEKMDVDKVTETTILDMMVEVDEATREAVTFKELRKGMRAWIKERRVRLRYCLEVEGLSDKSEPVHSFASFTSESGRRTKTGFIKDKTAQKKEPFNAIRQYVRKRNPQPLMPPKEIGTDVCDIPGITCNWHAVFPERLILAWRIQQKLEKLFMQSRWLDIKKLLRVFGYYRTAQYALVNEIELEQPPPEPEVLTSDERMERLAKHAPTGRKISTDAAVKRFSLRDDGNPLGMPSRHSPYTPSKVNRFSENDAELHLPTPYALTNDISTAHFAKSATPMTPPPAMIALRFSPQETSRLQMQALELRQLEDELAKYRSQSPGTHEKNQDTAQATVPSVHFSPQPDHTQHVLAAANTLVNHQDIRRLNKNAQQMLQEIAKSPHLHSEANILDHGKPRKKPSVAPTAQGDRTDYEKFLRRRFREIHNVWLVDPTPTDVLEALQLRAYKMLKQAAKQDEERLLAAIDPSRRNDSTRELVQAATAIMKETRKEIIAPPTAGAEKLNEQSLDRKELRATLLTQTTGLFKKDYCFMDSRTKAILARSRRLKSELVLEENDPRNFRKTSLSTISCRSAPAAVGQKSTSTFSIPSNSASAASQHSSTASFPFAPSKIRSRFSGLSGSQSQSANNNQLLVSAVSAYAYGSNTPEITPSGASSVRPIKFQDEKGVSKSVASYQTTTPVPQVTEDNEREKLSLSPELLFVDSAEVLRKQADEAAMALSKTPERRIERMFAQVTFLLESFLSEKRDHLMRGLTKQIKKQAREMQISQFQSVETVERRLVQQIRMKKIQDCYQGSIRRGMWTDFRQLIKSIRKRKLPLSSTEDNLRKVLLRTEDVDHRVESREAALAHFEELLHKACDGPVPSNVHSKWFKRYKSLPSFFPLSDSLNLMKTMQPFETAEIA